MLDGLSKIDDLLATAQEMEMPAIALTDHGVMHGALEFYVKATKAGIKPILGVEAYMSRRTRFDKEAGYDNNPFHLTLLAKSYKGYQNLIKMISLAHLEGYYYKPRIDKDLLYKYNEDVICLTGCIGAEIPSAIRDDQIDKAKDLLALHREIFGENLYVELHNTDLDFVNTAFTSLRKIAHDMHLPIVATNDVHYVRKEDAIAQDVLLAIQTKQEVDDPTRKLSLMDSQTFYLRSPKEMSELFYKYPEAIENTLKIADQIDIHIPMDEFIFPLYETPEGMDSDEYLKHLTYEKAQKKLGALTDEHRKRIDYELDIVAQKGYSTYFLIFNDIAQYCRDANIYVAARGSAVGSLALYALDVAPLNPLEYKLPFERFLNPERPSSPDIDLDMEDERRGDVIEFTKRRFGSDRVAQIVTFGKMEERSAVRDVGRALGLPYSFVDQIAKLIPQGAQGRHGKIENSLESVDELKKMYDENPDVKKLIEMAIKIQGTARHAGTHAAGIIVTDAPIMNYVPLMLDSKKEGVMTQFDMYSLDKNASMDAMGLLKLDFLGLRNLTIIRKSVDLINRYHGAKLDIHEIPLDDQAVFDLISSGETTGLFQIESSGFRQLARDLKPSNLEDIMAMIAMYRPGPMEQIPKFIESKKDPKKVEYPHPAIEGVLKDTYGVLVYQEQAMEIPQVMAGFTLGRADILRRAIGKKKLKLMAEEKKAFVKGAVEQGHKAKEAEEVFGYIERFASYGFNRSHSASYGLIVYQTAWLKVHYPHEYMTAMLSCESGKAEKVAMLLKECQRLGIQVLPPDINTSFVDFTIEEIDGERAIRFGLAAVKNVGDAALQVMVKEREASGSFANFYELCDRVDTSKVNKKVMESLIKVGALDGFGTRSTLLEVLPEYLTRASEKQKQQALGQFSLFGESNEAVHIKPMPKMEEMPKRVLLEWEKELLGFYLTEHPKEKQLKQLETYNSHKIRDLELAKFGSMVTISGVVSEMKRIVTKRGNKEMAFMQVTDFTGVVEAIVFPAIFQNGVREIIEDDVVLIKGKLENKDEKELKIIVEKIFVPEGGE